MSPLQDAECSGTAKDIVHLSIDSSIELVRESNAAAAADDELERATVVPP